MNNDKDAMVALLTELDIPENDANTYAALLRLDSTSIRKIAVETGINRGTTYESLKKLTECGLVSVRQNGKREQYTAESPEKVYDMIRDKRRDLLDIAETAKKVIPDVLARKASLQGRPLVRYYEGEAGVTTILKDVLQTCRTLKKPEYIAYSSSQVRRFLYRKFPQFTERRVAEGIGVKVIAVGAGGDEAPKAARKWLPDPKTGDISSYTIIYGAKVATISIAADNTPYGVIVEDNGAASMQRLLFDQLWVSLPDEKPPAVAQSVPVVASEPVQKL
ncbi:MAG TPA: helix-turn-helix domain-containing protein [Candidatus Saccharimonadales bacterium]|jgi:sugar-specific transcriptional regulator TrmB